MDDDSDNSLTDEQILAKLPDLFDLDVDVAGAFSDEDPPLIFPAKESFDETLQKVLRQVNSEEAGKAQITSVLLTTASRQWVLILSDTGDKWTFVRRRRGRGGDLGPPLRQALQTHVKYEHHVSQLHHALKTLAPRSRWDTQSATRFISTHAPLLTGRLVVGRDLELKAAIPEGRIVPLKNRTNAALYWGDFRKARKGGHVVFATAMTAAHFGMSTSAIYDAVRRWYKMRRHSK